MEVGPGEQALIQQLVGPSMAAVCPSVSVWWPHRLDPWSRSTQGLGESWGETKAFVSQALSSEHTGVQPLTLLRKLGSSHGCTLLQHRLPMPALCSPVDTSRAQRQQSPSSRSSSSSRMVQGSAGAWAQL